MIKVVSNQNERPDSEESQFVSIGEVANKISTDLLLQRLEDLSDKVSDFSTDSVSRQRAFIEREQLVSLGRTAGVLPELRLTGST